MKTHIITLLAIIALSSPAAAYAQSCCMSADQQDQYAHDADRAQQAAQDAQRAEQDRETQERAEQQAQADAERERTESEIRQSQGGY